MREFAAMSNLDLWYLHLNLAEMQARWGQEAKPKAMKALSANLTQAHHRDNQRALEKLTRRVDGEIRIAPRPPLIIPIEDLVPDKEQDQIGRKFMRGILRNYRSNLRGDHRHLLESYRYVHMARKVVGVGSVGTHNWIMLLLGRDDADPLFLQIKEAQASVLEPYLGKSVYVDHGRRVVEGQWLMQASSDIFLGWESAKGLDG